MARDTRSPLFDGWPEAERTIDVPVTMELRILRFCKRWGYSATAQEQMKVELEALIDEARK
jgi:hypothetical protein